MRRPPLLSLRLAPPAEKLPGTQSLVSNLHLPITLSFHPPSVQFLYNIHVSKQLTRVFILGCLLAAACTAASDPDAARTAAAATLDARLEVAQAESAVQTSEAEQATLQAELDSQQATSDAVSAAATATAAYAATQAAIPPQLISPDGTVCRIGPQAAFARAADIEAGAAIDIIARSTDGNWWQVPSPLDPAETCWVFWDADLDFLGEVFNLPLIEGPKLPTNTPRPTNPPGFSINYAQEINCSGTSYFIIAVTNTGPETYESVSMNLINADTEKRIAHSDGNNEFLPNNKSCPKGESALGPGESAFLGIRSGQAPAGASLRVSVRLCTENGLRGNCLSTNTPFSN
jgi:hypothetical protein